MQKEQSGTRQPAESNAGMWCGEAIVVDDVEVRVWMHESGTSAVAWFVDERACERRVAMIARPGGGALTTIVPKPYEPAMQALGYRLWPSAESGPRSGVHVIAADHGADDAPRVASR
jgi:hypothetical protein